jgi:hypothetical protein
MPTGPKTSTALRVVLLGYIVRGPLGGLVWHHLQYALCAAALGHDVHFLEDSGDWPKCCYDPVRDVTDADPEYGLRFASDTFGRVGLDTRWAYYDAHTRRWLGPASERALAICKQADVLVNLSGINPIRPWLEDIPVRALVDTDPVFTQIRHIRDEAARRSAAQHTSYFSFGENIGTTVSTVPDDGFPWQPTRQPLALDAWRVTTPPKGARYTTVMQWHSYRPEKYAGRVYGMKSLSFQPYIDFPRQTDVGFEIAVGGADRLRPRLEQHGWVLRDALEVAPDPWSYQRFIEASRGEFAVAKHGYAVTRSGWFSERSAAYLASGRPVVTQNTGFPQWLPAEQGVLAFDSPAEAAAAIAEVEGRYGEHCAAAREIAAEYFDGRRIVAQLIEAACGTNARPQRLHTPAARAPGEP